jgi:hypothetical protein
MGLVGDIKRTHEKDKHRNIKLQEKLSIPLGTPSESKLILRHRVNLLKAVLQLRLRFIWTYNTILIVIDSDVCKITEREIINFRNYVNNSVYSTLPVDLYPESCVF